MLSIGGPTLKKIYNLNNSYVKYCFQCLFMCEIELKLLPASNIHFMFMVFNELCIYIHTYKALIPFYTKPGGGGKVNPEIAK